MWEEKKTDEEDEGMRRRGRWEGEESEKRGGYED